MRQFRQEAVSKFICYQLLVAFHKAHDAICTKLFLRWIRCFHHSVRVEHVAVARFQNQFQCFIGRSEEHTSELQSRLHLVCRLLLEKKKPNTRPPSSPTSSSSMSDRPT